MVRRENYRKHTFDINHLWAKSNSFRCWQLNACVRHQASVTIVSFKKRRYYAEVTAILHGHFTSCQIKMWLAESSAPSGYGAYGILWISRGLICTFQMYNWRLNNRVYQWELQPLQSRHRLTSWLYDAAVLSQTQNNDGKIHMVRFNKSTQSTHVGCVSDMTLIHLFDQFDLIQVQMKHDMIGQQDMFVD